MSKESTFWMVLDKGPTQIRHAKKADAEREATRLAQLNPGAQVFVMEAVAVYQSKGVERRTIGSGEPAQLRKSLEEIVERTSAYSIAGGIARNALADTVENF